MAAAGQRDFDVPFPFLSTLHVEALVNGTAAQILEWTGPARLRLASPLSGGESVLIQRNTPIENALVQFHNGAVLTEEDLNTAIQQVLFKQQELDALYAGSLKRARIRLAENLGIVTDPEAVAQELAELVLEQDVLDNFRQRIADIDAAGSNIADLGITINAQASAITNVSNAASTTGTLLAQLRNDHQALAGVVDALANLEDGTGLAAIIQHEADARLQGDTALAATISLIGGKSGDSSSFILDLNKVKVSPTESLATRLTNINASVGANASAITAEQTARANGDTAEANARTALAATLRGETSALIQTERDARVSALSAEATARTNLAATLRAETASSVSQEASARSTADSAFAANFTLLGAKNANGTAWVLDDSKVQVTPGVTLGTRLSGIDVAIGNAASAIVNEQTARVNADGALSQSIGVVSTNVGNLSSSVSTLSQSVNGVLARYGVSLDVNGYVTGFVQNNNGSSGSFVVLADRFAIVQPGSAPFVPFEVSGGVTRIKEAVIGSLQVDKLVSGTLFANIGLNGDILVGTGRIIWDNGAYMKVTGVGFGTSSQFIEWYGPKMPISQCSEANAIQYLKTNGSAYFGGALSAGILKNAVQTSLDSSNASVSTGQFVSLGHARTVVLSYTFMYNATVQGVSPTFNGTLSAQVVLERSFDGYTWINLTTLNVSGEASLTRGDYQGQPLWWDAISQMNASTTYTDTGGGTALFYRARLVSRSHPVPGNGTIVQGGGISQNLSVISTET